MKIRATQRETATMFNLIEAHFHRSRNGGWAWDSGWDDLRVATEAGGGRLTVTHAKTLRLAEFGNLGTGDRPVDRLAVLEAAHNALCAHLVTPEFKVGGDKP